MKRHSTHYELGSCRIPRDYMRKWISVNLVKNINDIKYGKNVNLNIERLNLDHIDRTEQYNLCILYDIPKNWYSKFNLPKRQPIETYLFNYYQLIQKAMNGEP